MRRLSTEYPVRRISQVLGISRAGHYRDSDIGPRAKENTMLLVEIRRVFDEHKQRYGRPRIRHQLRSQGLRCGKNRVARLMREAGLRAITSRRKRPRTTDSAHGGPIAPNHLKSMDITAPNQAWAMDITYVDCGTGWVYLAAVLDLHLHKIVGWELADQMRSDLVEEALRKAQKRQGYPPSVLIHSDRGSQYASDILAGR